MNKNEIAELGEIIKEKSAITQEKLEKIIHFDNLISLKNNILCHYLLIKNTGDDIRENDFLKLIYQNIIAFVLNYEEYQNDGNLNGAELAGKFTDLLSIAKSKFQKTNLLTGEVGELILFLLLESQNISRVISKIRLKTNPEMPIHGVDAIHVQIDNGNIILHYGEAKMYNNFNDGLRSSIESIEKLDDKQKDIEIDLIRTNIDGSKFGLHTNKIIELLNPYADNKENLMTKHPIFIGYDWDVLNDLLKRNGKPLTDYLREEYAQAQTNYSNNIRSKVENSKIKEKSFHFFILPFKDVGKFRASFLEIL